MTNRKADRQVKHPELIIARGDLSSLQKSLLKSIMTDLFELSVTTMDPDKYDERQQRLATYAGHSAVTSSTAETQKTDFSFTQIKSPDQYLVREHLKDFKSLYPFLESTSKKNFVGKTFSYLVDGNGGSARNVSIFHTDRTRTYREPVPFDGIVVVSRESLGIGPYTYPLDTYGKSRMCGAYAVRAGSIVDTAVGLNNTDWHSLRPSEQAHVVIAKYLENQFKD
jgi:hypothetical protein